jgi:hypothetical protein
MRKPNWKHYAGLGLEQWIENRRKSKRNKIWALTLTALLIGFGGLLAVRNPEISKHLPKWEFGN